MSVADSGGPAYIPKVKRKKKSGFFRWFWRNRRIQVIFFLLVISVPTFMIVYGIVMPTKNYKPAVSTGTEAISTEGAGSVSLSGEQLAEVKKITKLENEKAYEALRLDLANKDSIYFILNIPDSAIVLEIKGVPVRINKILQLEISNRFYLISHENLLPWISKPFTLQSDYSTIPKSPIVIKQAPKDTIEAAKTPSGPLPPDSTSVYYTLYFDRNLVLEIEQANPLEKGNVAKVHEYLDSKKKESYRSVIETFKNPSLDNQPMMIRMVMSDSDAKAIYRAIPAKSHLILKL